MEVGGGVERTQTPQPNFIAANELVARQVLFDQPDPVDATPVGAGRSTTRKHVRIVDSHSELSTIESTTRFRSNSGSRSILGSVSGAPKTAPRDWKKARGTNSRQLTSSFVGGSLRSTEGDLFAAYERQEDVPPRVVCVTENVPLDDKMPVLHRRERADTRTSRKTSTSLNPVRSILLKNSASRYSRGIPKQSHVRISSASLKKSEIASGSRTRPATDADVAAEGRGEGGGGVHVEDRRMSLSEALKYFASITSITESTSTLRSTSSNLELLQRSCSSMSQREHTPRFGEVASMTFSDSDTAVGGSHMPPNEQLLHCYRLECATDLLDVLRTRGTVHEEKRATPQIEKKALEGDVERVSRLSTGSRQSQSLPRESRNESQSDLRAARRRSNSRSERPSPTPAPTRASSGEGAGSEKARVEKEPSERELCATLTFASTSARYRQRARDSESALSDFRAWRSQWARDFSYTRRGARDSVYIDPDTVRSLRGHNPTLPPVSSESHMATAN